MTTTTHARADLPQYLDDVFRTGRPSLVGVYLDDAVGTAYVTRYTPTGDADLSVTHTFRSRGAHRATVSAESVQREVNEAYWSSVAHTAHYGF